MSIEEKDYPLTLERENKSDSHVIDASRALTGKQKYAEHEAHVIASAKHFYACEYHGSARYTSVECASRAAALAVAKRLIDARDPANIFSKGRPVMIYAHNGTYQVQCDLVFPEKRNKS